MSSQKNRFISILVAIALTLGSYLNVEAAGKIYYVSTTGSDANLGTASAPFKTFTKAMAVIVAGDELQIYGGTYAQELAVSKSGTSSAYITIKPVLGQRVIIDGGMARKRGIFLSGNYIVLEGLEVRRALDFCVDVTGSYVTVRSVNVYSCYSSGLRVKGKNDVVENSLFHNISLKNSGGTATSWGVALRVMLGGENVTLRNNKVYSNWGEGLSVLQAKNVNVLNNTVFDNYSQNIYIDNSMDVSVENNFVYSTNSTFFRAGLPANCISMAEEFYDGWGAQLARIRIVNNIAAFCRRGIGYTYAEVTNGGMDTVTIANNTIWKTRDTGIVVINQTTKTRNSVIANNIVHQGSGKLADIKPSSGILVHHNFWVSPVSLLYHASGTGDKTGYVRLATTPTTDPTTFRLSSISPAIGAAADLGITKDFEGKNRTLVYDMGAIEYSGAVSTAPTPTPNVSSSVGGGTYDDAHSAWRYSSGWTAYTNTSGPYNNTSHVTSVIGSYGEISFNGSSFTFIYTKASNRGSIDVYVDGSKIGTINAYNSSTVYQSNWTSPTLTDSTHIARFVYAGGGTSINIDAIQIAGSSSSSSSSLSAPLIVETTPTETLGLPSPTMPVIATSTAAPPLPSATAESPSTATTYDDKNPVFAYSGEWSDMNVVGAYADSFKKSMVPGSSVEMTFSGKSFTFLYTTNSAFGKADVFVDEVLVGTIDQYSAFRQLQQKWDLPIALAAGTHTLKLVHQGSDTTRITLDAVIVYP